MCLQAISKAFGAVWAPQGVLLAFVAASFPGQLSAADARNVLCALPCPGGVLTFPGAGSLEFAILSGKLDPEKVMSYAVLPLKSLLAADAAFKHSDDASFTRLPPLDHPTLGSKTAKRPSGSPQGGKDGAAAGVAASTAGQQPQAPAGDVAARGAVDLTRAVAAHTEGSHKAAGVPHLCRVALHKRDGT